MSIDYKLIGGRIKATRCSLGYTQEWLAERLDVTVGYISQVERGITKISLDLLSQISAALNCEISTLVAGSSVDSANYMNSELNTYYAMLNKRDKKLVIEFMKILVDSKE